MVISNKLEYPFKQFNALIFPNLIDLGPEILVFVKFTESHGTAKSAANFNIESLQLGNDIPAVVCRNFKGVGLLVFTTTDAFHPEQAMLLSDP
jgi:hypothetical protein